MKRCPQCQRAYADDTLRFCLDDGVPLSASYRPEVAHAAATSYRDDPQTEILPINPYPPQQSKQRTHHGYLYILASLFIVAIGVLVVSAGVLAWLKLRRTDAPARYATQPGANRRSNDSGQGRTPTPAPSMSQYSDPLKSLLLGSWTWGNFMESFSPDGTGTFKHEGQTCFNYKYEVSGGVLHMIVVGERKCGPSGLDYRISIDGDQMRQEFTGNGYVTNWKRVR